MSLRVLARLILTTVALLVASAAHAQGAASFSLNWVRANGAETCIGSHEIAALVERSLGPVFAAPGETALAIEGQVYRSEDQWYAQVAVAERSGAIKGRRLLQSQAESCRALDARIALVIQLAIDPEIALEALPPELLALVEGSGEESAANLLSELRSESAEASRSAPAQPGEQTPADATARPLPSQARTSSSANTEPSAPHPPDQRIALVPSIALGTGALPTLAVGPGLALALRLGPRWRLGLAARLWLPQTVAINAPAARPADASLTVATSSLRACLALAHPFGGRWDLCAGPEVAVRFASARGLEAPNTAAVFRLGATVDGELALPPVGPVAPMAGLGLHLPFARERITYRDTARGMQRTLFTEAALGFSAHLGVAVFF